MDFIEIDRLRVSCILGVRPREREFEQPVFADVRLGIDLRAAGSSGRITDTCDYDRISVQIAALLAFRRYRLLEMAAEELSAMLLGVNSRIQSVRLKLTKPLALGDRARGAAVEVERNVRDFPRRHESTQFGEVDVLFESQHAGLYLLHVAGGRVIPPHYHQVMRELEWLVSGELYRDNEAIPRCQPVTWARGQVHTYENRSDRPATLFCCDTPPFQPDDEIELEGRHQGTDRTALPQEELS